MTVLFSLDIERGDFFFAIFHQPFGGGGGTTDAYAAGAFEPFGLDGGRTVDQVALGVDLLTGGVEDLAVAALESADEDDDVVASSKFLNVGQSVGYLTADGIEGTELCRSLDVLGDVVDDLAESFQGLGGL